VYIGAAALSPTRGIVVSSLSLPESCFRRSPGSDHIANEAGAFVELRP
jgi:hypothetical protein